MKITRARKTLNELVEWIRYRSEQIEDWSRQIYTEPAKLQDYGRKLSELSEEMRQERETSLKLARAAVDTEVRQGFYDLAVSEHLSKVERDWVRLKHRLTGECDKVDHELSRLAEFDRSIAHVRIWVQDQTRLEMDNLLQIPKKNLEDLSSIDEDKKILSQVCNYKELLNQIEELSRALMCQEHVRHNLNELRINLDRMEQISGLKIQSNLGQLKRNFSAEMRDLNARLESEVEFAKRGRITSSGQLETSARSIFEYLAKIEEARGKMERILRQIEQDLAHHSNKNGLKLNQTKTSDNEIDSNNLKQNNIIANLSNLTLEQNARELAEIISSQIQPWSELEGLQLSIKELLRIEPDDIKLEEFAEKGESLMEDFNNRAKILGDRLRFNEATWRGIEEVRSVYQVQFERIWTRVEARRRRCEDSRREEESLRRIAESVEALSKKVQFARTNELDECDIQLKQILDTLRLFEVKDAAKIGSICELNEICSSLMLAIRDKRVETGYHSSVRIIEVQKFIETFEIRRDEDLKLEFRSDKSRQNIIHNTQQLSKLVKCLRNMINQDQELHRIEKLLEDLLKELSPDREAAYRIKDKIIKIRKQIGLIVSPNGLLDSSTRLLELCHELDANVDKSVETNLTKLDLLRRFHERLHRIRAEFEDSLTSLEVHSVSFLDRVTLHVSLLEPLENYLASLIAESESLSELQRRYSSLCVQIGTSLSDIDKKLIDYNRTTAKLISLGENLEFERLEAKFNYYKGVKAFLSAAQLKTDIESLQKMGSELIIRVGRAGQHETLRISYLELICRIDQEMKSLEMEFADWKTIVNISRKVLDFVKETHHLLAGVSMSKSRVAPKQSEDDEYSFGSEFDLKSDKSLNQLIDWLKFDVGARLNEHEALVNEVTELGERLSIRSSAIRTVVENVKIEWGLLRDKFNLKIVKLEKFRSKLNELDLKLNSLREKIKTWETYLGEECFAGCEFVDFQQIISKKTELEEFMEALKKKEPEALALFKLCLSANRNNLNCNKQNRVLVDRMKERWNNLKNQAKEKILLMQNLWVSLCDLNDQIENFYLVLNKTDTFYRNTLLTVSESSGLTLRLVQELYETIKDDYKSIKYINESYVNFSRLASHFSVFHLLDKLKHRLLSVNSEWDRLHNEIAIKIKIEIYQYFIFK